VVNQVHDLSLNCALRGKCEFADFRQGVPR
jgi:hypothetical protein